MDILPDLSVGGWLIVVVCGVLVGFTKTGVAGLGLVIVPLLAMVFEPHRSPGVLLPMLCMADVLAVIYYHRHAVWAHVLRPMPWAVAGIVVTFVVLKCIPLRGATYGRLIGAVVLICIGIGLVRSRRGGKEKHGALFAAAVGVLGGFATMAANAAGPIWVVYLLAMGLPKYELIGTGAWFFFALNLLKVPFQANLGNITGSTLALNGLLLPAILAGGWLGIRTVRRMDQRLFNRVIQALAAAGAVKLILS